MGEQSDEISKEEVMDEGNIGESEMDELVPE